MKDLKCIVFPTCYKNIRIAATSLCILTFIYSIVGAQDYEIHKNNKGVVISDYDPATKLGDDVFGTNISDFSKPVNIGSRLELFVDSLLIGELNGVELRLHSPTQLPIPESPLKGDYMTVIKDEDLYRAYYRDIVPNYKGSKSDGHNGEITCYAESNKGHEWTFPKLGLFSINGSYKNNVIFAKQPPFSHNFSPFLDTRPGIDPKEHFKALAGTKTSGLHAFISNDGIHWEKTGKEAVIASGYFDSQNVSFWSNAEQKYVCYFRTFIKKTSTRRKLRSISRATSKDFINWTEPISMNPNLPEEQLYTSQTQPYYRAPHIYIALPTRFQYNRIAGKDTSGNVGSTDILFMASRAGSVSFSRLFKEAFIRPGIDPDSWGDRANYVALNVVPTGDSEMSIYHKNGHRYILRTDGFTSVYAGADTGEMVTKPLIFSGNELVINYSTSTGGMIKVEIQDVNGTPISGFNLNDCSEIVGDEIEHRVDWKDSPSIETLAGKPIRLHFEMKDCDLYSIKFR